MKANLQKIRKQRVYSIEFKQQLVKDYESGKFSVLELEKLYGVSNPSIYNWIYKFSNFNEKGYRIVEHKESSSKKLRELELRIKELEGVIGRKQISIDYLEKMIEIAKDEYKIDIKKNSNTPQSSGSNKTLDK